LRPRRHAASPRRGEGAAFPPSDRSGRLIYGIAAIAYSHVFVANAHYVFGNLPTGVGSP